MPGHKGVCYTGSETRDITEIPGADSLYFADGIISESEKYASELFGTGKTCYSAEGSSLSVRAMLALAKQYQGSLGGYVIAGRNAHSSFITAAALLDFSVKWLYPSSGDPYLSCSVTADTLREALSECSELPFAVYITSPDYLGNISDIEALSAVCREYSVPLLVDNAHGAYLKFLSSSRHPIDLGADMCCDSAHKTLPVLTGGAYLHISKNAPEFFRENAKRAMALFGSTSPSYLILESLDLANKYISDGYGERLSAAAKEIAELKKALVGRGFAVVGDEPMKLTIKISDSGYSGEGLARYLSEVGIVSEFYDPDFIVFMFSAENAKDASQKLLRALSDVLILTPDDKGKIEPFRLEARLSIREAVFARCERVPLKAAVGRILAGVSITCPPAVSLIVAGEVITEEAIRACEYYGKEELDVVI